MRLVPAFPLGTAFLPGDAVVLRVFESRYLELLRVVLEGDRCFVSALISAGSEVGGGDKRFNVGVLVEIDHVEEADVGLMLYGHATAPVNIAHWDDAEVFPRAMCLEQEVLLLNPRDREIVAHGLKDLADIIDEFFGFLESYDIPLPAPTGFVPSLIPNNITDLTDADHMHIFWSFARLLPLTPLARFEILGEESLFERIDQTRDQIEHLRDIVRFRYEK